MQKLLFVALCAVLAAGCSNSTPQLHASTQSYDDSEVVAANDSSDEDVSEYASSGSQGVSAASIDTGIAVLSGALGVLGGVAAMNNAANAAYGARAVSAGAAAAASVSASQGYSQVGAFNECQQMYAGAGQSALAAECARRASNMSSLTPVR